MPDLDVILDKIKDRCASPHAPAFTTALNGLVTDLSHSARSVTQLYLMLSFVYAMTIRYLIVTPCLHTSRIPCGPPVLRHPPNPQPTLRVQGLGYKVYTEC